MATAEFSEFSYGYALTSSLVTILGKGLTKAPIFPSLIAEGSQGGGYDLKLPAIPVPIFLQFKVPSVLIRKSKLKPPGYVLPYYRIPLRTKHPNQHQLLLVLEATQPLVFYVAPLFHQITDLDNHFSLSSVAAYSTFIKPSKIGLLHGSSHQLSYQPGTTQYWVFSEPRPVEQGWQFADFLKSIVAAKEVTRARHVAAAISELTEQRREAIAREELDRLTRDILRVEEDAESQATESAMLHGRYVSIEAAPLRQTRPAQLLNLIATSDSPTLRAKRLAYYAQVRLGLTLAFVDASDEPN